MSREKIKVPGKAYEELIALQREIHFTQDHQDTIKKADDRGYMNAANWIRQNESAYKIGFAWGFEPEGEAQQGSLQRYPGTRATGTKTHDLPPYPVQPRTATKKSSAQAISGGILSGIKNWLGKYF